MNAIHWAMELMRADGTRIGQKMIEPDLSPLVESARLRLLRRRGPAAAAGYDRPVKLDPVWHEKLGEPYVGEVAAQVECDDSAERYPSAIFRPWAKEYAAELIEENKLADGDTYGYLVSAYPRAEEQTGETNGTKFRIHSLPVNLPVKEGSWEATVGAEGPACGEELRVALPRHVLEEAAAHTRGRSGIETGGVLIGHLRWDGDLFVEITEQIHATHAAGESTKLHFTPSEWTEVRRLMELRGQGESILGWWHSHPVRNWCGKCPEERQRGCPLRKGFLSADDKMLHRTVFPRAFMPALVASDVAYGDVEFALFGWEDGMMEPRGYYLHGGGVQRVRPGETGQPEKREEEACAKN
jgi:hypothetical protein